MQYEYLFQEWAALTHLYKGWTLEDIKNLSVRERRLWIEFGLAKRKRGN